MTREEILSLVIANTRRSDKQDLMVLGIGLALQEISQRHAFKEMREEIELGVAAGESLVALPENFLSVVECRLVATGQTQPVTNLGIWPKETVVKRVPDLMPDTQARPAFGYLESGHLVLVPKADQPYVLKMTYYVRYRGLSVGESLPGGMAMGNAVVAWVTSFVFKSVQLYEDAAFWQLEFERALRHAISADRRRDGTILKHEGFEHSNQKDYESLTPWLDPFARR
mgnify:CR=1 FL=1